MIFDKSVSSRMFVRVSILEDGRIYSRECAVGEKRRAIVGRAQWMREKRRESLVAANRVFAPRRPRRVSINFSREIYPYGFTHSMPSGRWRKSPGERGTM